MKPYRRIVCALLAGALLAGALSFAAPRTGGAPEAQADVPALVLDAQQETAYRMKVGDRVQLCAPEAGAAVSEGGDTGSGSGQETGDADIYWAPENPDVVSVTQDGLVTALAQSEQPVEVAGRYESGVILVCNITVSGYAVTELTLTPARGTMQVGETQTVAAEILPEEAAADAVLTWWSSDESVLTVAQDGTVTAAGEGTAEVLAQAENGLTASCTIAVSGWALTGFTLEPSALTLKAGQSQRLTAVAQPEGAQLGALRWRSDALEVASVAQDGTVTAHKAGTAVITAEDEDGRTASSTVTVTAAPAETVTAISLNRRTMTLTVGGTGRLTAAITPASLQNTATVTWTSGNAAVARVSGGTVTARKAGTAVITASVGEVRAQCTVTVKNKPTGSGSGSTTGTTGTTGVTGGGGILYLPGTLIPIESTRLYTMPQYIPDTVFLTVDSDMGAQIVSMLSVLESAGMQATFFVPVENLYASDDLLRHIAGDGHSIGLLLTRAQAQANPVELLNSANEALSVITGTPTRLVRIAGGSGGNLSREAAQAIRAGGYRLWDWSASPRTYDAAVGAMNRTGTVTVRFDSSANTAAVLQKLLPYMKYCGIPARGIGAGDTPICQTP